MPNLAAECYDLRFIARHSSFLATMEAACVARRLALESWQYLGFRFVKKLPESFHSICLGQDGFSLGRPQLG